VEALDKARNPELLFHSTRSRVENYGRIKVSYEESPPTFDQALHM